MSPIRLDTTATMVDSIMSIRDAGGWQEVMRELGQDPDTLFTELIGAVAEVPGEEPTMFEFWMVGFLGGLAAQAVLETHNQTGE